MKTIVCAVALAVLNAWGGVKSEAPRFVVAEKGVARADIIIPSKALGVERYAADELKHHLDKAFGLRFEIVREDAFDPSKFPCHFYLGATHASVVAGLPGRKLKPDERFLRTVGNGLYLIGRDGGTGYETIGCTWCPMHLGTLYAVYDFLENELCVKWIWPGETGEVIPKRTSLCCANIDRGGIEPLAERYWHGTASWGDKMGFTNMKSLERFYAEQSKFLVRHRVGRRVNTRIMHSFADWWGRFGKDHPEYFNLLCDGMRRPVGEPSLVTMCCSEPGVWKQKVKDWVEWWQKEGERGGYEPLVNCCENDSAGLCQCPRCRAWDAPDSRFSKHPYWNGKTTKADLDDRIKRLGFWGVSSFVGDNRWDIPKEDANLKPVASLSDRYANFYNHIQAEVAKVNAKARVCGYAYENYIEAPLKTKVDPRVLIEYVARSYFPYDQTESEFFRKSWKGWHDAGVREFNYRPNYMLAGGNYLFDQGKLILDDFAFAYTNGMRGCMFDSLRGSWSAHALMDYALIRAFRDPLHGYDRAREEMLSSFGAARGPVAKYLDGIYAHTTAMTFAEIRKMSWDNYCGGTGGGGSFVNCAAILGEFFDEGFFVECKIQLAEALKAAAGDADVIGRIKFLYKGLRDTELTRKVRIAQKSWKAELDNAEKKDAFDAAFKRMNDYRATVENDCVCNFMHAAQNERNGLGWPHKLLEEKKK